jgi:hypothetical protein
VAASTVASSAHRILFELGKDRLPGKRQTRYSQKLKALGLCWCHKSTRGKSLCADHLRAQAKRMRERQ